ncbi:unnamed protein product [Owenia fusiformis]|uniref:Polycystic kidney disease protein 1-like 2 n=1 Tax=Owenia fusiformis TaxID=6347 RepID=A0A8S4NX84_OWEFU|nr:unnamed protein product [Owenia fusiformis]
MGATIEATQYQTGKKNSSKPHLQDMRTNEQVNNQAKEITDATMNVLKDVADAVLKNKVVGEEPTVIETEALSMTVMQSQPESLGDHELSVGSTTEGSSPASILLPSADALKLEQNDITSSTDIFDKVYQLYMYQMKENPYIWHSSAESVTTDLMGIEMRNSKGNVMKMENLSENITIHLPTKDKPDLDKVILTVPITTQGNTTVNTTIMSEFKARDISVIEFRVAKGAAAVIKIQPVIENITLRVHVKEGKRPVMRDMKNNAMRIPHTADTLYRSRTNKTAHPNVIYVPRKNRHRTLFIGILLENNSPGNAEFIAGYNMSVIPKNETQAVPVELNIGTYTSKCLFWSESLQLWSNEGCFVSPLAMPESLSCDCNHMTAFSGSFFVLPNKVDPIDDAKLFLSFFDNPVTISTMLAVWFLYIILVVYARKHDRKDLLHAGVTILEDNNPSHHYGYLVTTVTGWRQDASTSANVFLQLNGTEGSSEPHHLKHWDEKAKIFCSGSEDYFLLTSDGSIGFLNSITIWHDNTGDYPNWYLNQVTVRDLQGDQVWHFLCNRWLAIDLDDFAVSRTLLAANEGDLQEFSNAFPGLASRDMREKHLWLSIFSKPPESHFTRVQRLTCAFTLLLSYMLTKIMFFGIPKDDPEDQMQIGQFHFSISAIVIGLECSLLMFPFNLIIVQLFRLTKEKPGEQRKFENFQSFESVDTMSVDTLSDSGDHHGIKKLKSEPLLIKDRVFFSPEKSEISKSKDNQNDDLTLECIEVDVSEKTESVMSNILTSESPTTISSKSKSLISDSVEEETRAIPAHRSRKATLERKGEKADRDLFSEEDSYVELQEKKKEPLGLPWWFIYINWTLSVLICLSASYFIMLYGLKYGYQASIEWLTSIFVAFSTSILFIQPVKVITIAILCALICKRKPEIQDRRDKIDKDDKGLTESEKLEQYLKTKVSHMQYKPLDSEWLAQERERRFKEHHMWETFQDIVIYVVFILTLAVVVHGHHDLRAYRQTKSMEDMVINAAYEGDVAFGDVSTVDSMWDYLRNTMVPSLYAEYMYNGDSISHLGIASDLVTTVVGVIRLRQQRIEKGTCDIYPLLKKQFSYCTGTFTWTNEDYADYGPYWSPLDGPPSRDIWSYKTASELNTLPLAGHHRTYSGGGYLVELTKSRNGSRSALDDAKNDGWVDERTRVIIVEYTTFNPNTNLFSVCSLMFEFLTPGQILTFPSILTVKLYHYSNGSEILVAVCEVLFLVLLLISTVKEIRSVKAHGGLKGYFQDSWKFVEVLEILISYSAIAVFFNRLVIVNSIISKFYDSNGQGFVSFYPAVFWDYVLNYIFAFLMILNVMKLFKLLNFNPKMRMLSDVFVIAGRPLIHFAIMFAIVLMAFTHFAMMYYGSTFDEFSTGMHTLITLVHMLLAEFDSAHIVEYSLPMGIIFTVAFLAFVYIMTLNLMLSILDNSFTAGSHSTRDTASVSDILAFVIKKFKVCSGLRYLKLYRRWKKFWAKNVTVGDDIGEEPQKLSMKDIL